MIWIEIRGVLIDLSKTKAIDFVERKDEVWLVFRDENMMPVMHAFIRPETARLIQKIFDFLTHELGLFIEIKEEKIDEE